MLRNLIRLTVLLLIAHALYRFVPPYVHYHQFKDAVAEAALFARDRPDAEIVERVMTLAERYGVPVERDAVRVTRDSRFTYISVSYEESIELLPSYRRTMPFSVSVEGWHSAPGAGAGALR